jgi:hypothetical protein
MALMMEVARTSETTQKTAILVGSDFLPISNTQFMNVIVTLRNAITAIQRTAMKNVILVSSTVQ